MTMRHRRRKSQAVTAAAATHTLVTPPPPCATTARTAGGGAFRRTLEVLLIAEIDQHLDSSFLLEASQHTTAPATASATTALVGDPSPGSHRGPPPKQGAQGYSDSELSSTWSLAASENARPSQADGQSKSTGTSTRRAPLQQSRSTTLTPTLGAETPGGDEQQLPSMAAYQRAIMQSILGLTGAVSLRLPPLRLPPLRIIGGATTTATSSSSSSASGAESAKILSGCVASETPVCAPSQSLSLIHI